MAHTITPSSDGKYILIKVTGIINRQLAIKYNVESHQLGQQIGINRYLMDLTECINTDTVVDTYEFAYDDMQETPEIDRQARIAVLVSPGDHSHDFIETVARNTGLDVTLFTDRTKAVNHLLLG